MPPFTSEQFHAITRANPECVWNALTATGVPLDYLHEMTADTDWQPGARVTLGADRSMAPHRRGPGRRAALPAVLHPRRPTRLPIGVRHLAATRHG